MPRLHVPTDETRAKVDALAVSGATHEMIGKIIGIDPKTLRKHYHEILETALDKTIANVSNTLVQKALSGDTASIIFFLKVRGKDKGWSERLEHTGEGGGPIQTITRRIVDPNGDA